MAAASLRAGGLSRRGGCGLAGAAAAKVAPQAAGCWWGETWGGAREQAPNLVSAKLSAAKPIKPSLASPRQFASPVCGRAACSVWLSGSGDSGVELEAFSFGALRARHRKWVPNRFGRLQVGEWAGSSLNLLYFVNFGYPFNGDTHARPAYI